MPAKESLGPAFIFGDWLRRACAANGALPTSKAIDVNVTWNVKGGSTRTKTGSWALLIFRNDPSSNWPYDTRITVDGTLVDTRSSVQAGDCIVGPVGTRIGDPRAEQPVPRIIVSKTSLVLEVLAGTNTGSYLAQYVMVNLV